MPRTRADVYKESNAPLSEEQLQEILKAFQERFSRLNDQYLRMMGGHIKEIGQLWPSDVHRLQQIRRMNNNLKRLERRIAEAADASIEDIEDIFNRCAASDVRMAAKILGLPDSTTLKGNPYLEKILEAQFRETAGTMRNLSNTTVVSSFYRKAVDEAVQAVQTGVEDYNTAIRRVIREAGCNGLRVTEEGTTKVDYESGYSRRLDSAARMNVLDGLRHMNQNMLNALGDQFGANGVEIDAHMLCAEDHLPYQGQQYSDEEFQEIQDSLPRPFGEWNCRHSWHRIILGVSPRLYSDDQLDEMKNYSREKIEIDGTTKTRYEWSQEMRRVETAIRQQKDTANLAKASGDKTLSDRCRANVLRLNKYYQQLSDKSGLKAQFNRTYVPGYRDAKSTNVLTNTSNSGTMLSDSSRKHTKVTEESIRSVPVFTEFGSEKVNNAVHDACVDILTGFKNKIGIKENSISIRLSDMHQEYGQQDKGAVRPVDFDEPYIAIHNHPSNETFSLLDASRLFRQKYCMGVVAIGNNGKNAYTLLKGEDFNVEGFQKYWENELTGLTKHKKEDFFREAEKYGIRYISRKD